MIPEIRKVYNAKFTDAAYNNFLNEINTMFEYPADFRISETPVFLTDDLTNLLVEASSEISAQLLTPEFQEHSLHAIPEGWHVPGEPKHPEFLQIDFGITKDDKGNYIPKLIELQAFPTIYGYQYFLNKVIRKHFDIDNRFTPYFSGYNDESYISALKDLILNGHSPENVILLEIQPEKQKTRIDFAATKKLIGIESVCISKVFPKGDRLFYFKNNKETRIKRIYNRVIFDELMKTNIKPGFIITNEFDVECAGNPNWFYKISKHSLPWLSSKFAPKAFFLNEFYKDSHSNDMQSFPRKSRSSSDSLSFPRRRESHDNVDRPGLSSSDSLSSSTSSLSYSRNHGSHVMPENINLLDLSKYVLKPLFSFAGSGVEINPTKEKLDSIKDKQNYILQEKIEYAPVIKTPDGNSKFEIRMMYFWKDKLVLVNNLVRMSKGKMMGVDYNKNKTWVGSSLALHR